MWELLIFDDCSEEIFFSGNTYSPLEIFESRGLNVKFIEIVRKFSPEGKQVYMENPKLKGFIWI